MPRPLVPSSRPQLAPQQVGRTAPQAGYDQRTRDACCDTCYRPPARCLCPCAIVDRDLRRFPSLLRDDAKGLINTENGLILGAGLGAAIGIHQDLDGEVREEVAASPKRWGTGSEFLGHLGEPHVQVPALLGLYAYGVNTGDEELHDLSKTLIRAYTITGLSTLAIKGIANTDRPSDGVADGNFGFPSHHTSSSFAIASVLHEYYGAQMGLPAYAVAGMIGWSRIDERDHDLSDVVFGAAMGYVIGHSIAGRHLRDDSRVRLLPWTDPADGSSGLMLETRY